MGKTEYSIYDIGTNDFSIALESNKVLSLPSVIKKSSGRMIKGTVNKK